MQKFILVFVILLGGYFIQAQVVYKHKLPYVSGKQLFKAPQYITEKPGLPSPVITETDVNFYF